MEVIIPAKPSARVYHTISDIQVKKFTKRGLIQKLKRSTAPQLEQELIKMGRLKLQELALSVKFW